MSQAKNKDYLLGVNQSELDRLRFQQTVWGPVTNNFFDRIGVATGWKCLDVGAGPGLVSSELRGRVGERGEVTALEPGKFYRETFAQEIEKQRWTNVKIIDGTAEEVVLRPEHYDLIFVRWVVSFVPDLEKFMLRLFRALRPGGVIAVQDYYYEGLALHPRGGPWDRMPDVVRAYYRYGKGDPYVTGKLPALFRNHSIRLTELHPTQLAGGPESGVFGWAHRFFTVYTPIMAEKGIITQRDAEELMADWETHRKNADALFFSPIVVDVAGVLDKQ
jgi:SAM-dependent methyltransferase